MARMNEGRNEQETSQLHWINLTHEMKYRDAKPAGLTQQQHEAIP
jgi:hypothetical protein